MNSTPDLLERDAALSAWQSAWQALQRGSGHCVVVSGEAGVGKTSLIAAAEAPQRAHMRWLKSRCDALHTPRPLGPLVDLVNLDGAFPPAVVQALQAGHTYNGLFPALLQWLRQQRPGVVLVIEDLHWADEATLDSIRYLARRLADAPFVLVLSLRAEQLDANPPLRQTLAALDTSATTRIELAPLSAAATAEMARRSGRSAQGLHALTGGNPFYLQQWLAAPADTLPGSLRDAVLAQLTLLSDAARQALEVIACSPGGLELEHLQALDPAGLKALQQPSAASLLQTRLPWTGLRHELARRVVEEALPPMRRWDIHRQLLQRLQDQGDKPELLARKVHHAAAAGLSGEVFRMAPQAARAAETVGANRAAARLLQLALDHADGASPADRAGLLDRLALRLHAVQASADSQAARRQAIELLRASGDSAGAAYHQALLALQLAQGPQAMDHAREAVATLSQQGTAAQRAMAHGALAILLANTGRGSEALEHARHAALQADGSGDADCRIHAGSIAASVELSVAPTPEAYDRLAQRIADAIALNQPNRAGVPMVNLTSIALAHGEHARVLAVTETGLAYCAERDMDMVRANLVVRRALALGECARWDELLATLEALDTMPAPPLRQLRSAAVLRDRVAGLRGTPADADTWRGHVHAVLQGQSDLIPAFAYVAAAEAAWLRQDLEEAGRLAQEGLADAESAWLRGQLRKWLRLAGGTLPAETLPLPAPAAAAEAGDWQRAHDLWLAHACPFEAALALAGGDAAAQQRAVAALLVLNADGAARVLRRQLQASGQRSVARGPYGHARRDPHGLSQRERQIAELLAEGLSNPQIAERVHRSERTVEHHVSAVLSKLGVASRAEVAARLPAATAAETAAAPKPARPPVSRGPAAGA